MTSIFGGLPDLAGVPTPVSLDEFPGFPSFLVQPALFPANKQGLSVAQPSAVQPGTVIVPGDSEIELGDEGVPIYFTWDGQRYQPNALLGNTERAKIFVGPADPSQISGIVLSVFDTWSVTS